MLALPVVKQHKTNHWESSAEGHNNLESGIVQQVFACVELQGVCTADLALLSSGCICTVHCEIFPSLYPWPHTTESAVLPTTCPARRKHTARPGPSLAWRCSAHRTMPVKHLNKMGLFATNTSRYLAPNLPPPSTEPLSRREGNLPREMPICILGTGRVPGTPTLCLLCRESEGSPVKKHTLNTKSLPPLSFKKKKFHCS